MTALTEVKALETKEVSFNGQTLLGFIDESGNVYTNLKRVCENLDLRWNRQLSKIKENEVLCEGMHEMVIPSNSGIQRTIVYNVDYLPTWLLTIKPNKVKEEVKPMLIKYQKEAVKVLRDAFIKKEQTQQKQKQLPQNYLEALKHLVQAEETKLLLEAKIEQDKPKIETYNQIMTSNTALDFSAVAKMFNTGRNRLFKLCREKGYLRANNEPYQDYIDSGLFETIIVNKRTASDFNANFIKTLITPKGIEKIKILLQGDN